MRELLPVLTGNMHVCESMKIIGVHVPGAFADYTPSQAAPGNSEMT